MIDFQRLLGINVTFSQYASITPVFFMGTVVARDMGHFMWWMQRAEEEARKP